jgi:hypothetical protein
VAAGVGVLQWVVVNVRVPVQRLRPQGVPVGRVTGLRYQRVRRDEAAQRGVVVAGAVVQQAKAGLRPLAGEPELVGKGLTFRQEFG